MGLSSEDCRLSPTIVLGSGKPIQFLCRHGDHAPKIASTETEDYFNSLGEKTLRAYTVPLNLARFDRQNWLTDDTAMDTIADALDHIRRVPLITKRMERRLLPVDPLALKAGLLGSNPEGLFKFKT